MRITHIDEVPVAYFPALTAAPRSGRPPRPIHIPMFQAYAEDWPEDCPLEALIITADLQFRDVDLNRLMGQVIADELGLMAAAGVLTEPDATGVIIAGDMYAVPGLRKRGGLGDVTPIWAAFSRGFKWVAGVAGNHDSFNGRVLQMPDHPMPLLRLAGCSLIDDDVVELDGMQIGGLSGIPGSNQKPWRRPEAWCESAFEALLEMRPDIVVMHAGPDGPSGGGHEAYREILERCPHPPLVICGHCYWDEPLAEYENGSQTLNVDSRVVLLKRAEMRR
ncbi:MAG: metallophosphoesterase [Bradymonadia bacterium]